MKWENSYFLPLQEVFLDCRANFNILIDTALILHYIVAARFKRKSDHTLIQDHTFIDFAKIVHPPCLFRTTPLFGPLEYLGYSGLNLANMTCQLVKLGSFKPILTYFDKLKPLNPGHFVAQTIIVEVDFKNKTLNFDHSVMRQQ